MLNSPVAARPRSSAVIRSTKVKAAKWAFTGSRRSAFRGSGGGLLALRAHHQLAECLGGEQPRHFRHLHRRLEALGGHFVEEGAQPLHACLGDDALVLEVGFGQVAAGFLDDAPTRDLDLERPLEAEYQIEK